MSLVRPGQICHEALESLQDEDEGSRRITAEQGNSRNFHTHTIIMRVNKRDDSALTCDVLKVILLAGKAVAERVAAPFWLMKCSATAKQIAQIPQAVNEGN